MENNSDNFLAFRIGKAAEVLGVSPKTLWNWTAPRGPIRCIRIGRGKRQTVLYPVAELQAWLDRETKEQNGGQA
jgi:hypothetical protein